MTKPLIRLALRHEGNFWNAYVALPDTMEGAFLIGSIAMWAVARSPKFKRAFMDVMQGVMTDHLKALGATVNGYEERSAPEHERAGHA